MCVNDPYFSVELSKDTSASNPPAPIRVVGSELLPPGCAKGRIVFIQTSVRRFEGAGPNSIIVKASGQQYAAVPTGESGDPSPPAPVYIDIDRQTPVSFEAVRPFTSTGGGSSGVFVNLYITVYTIPIKE